MAAVEIRLISINTCVYNPSINNTKDCWQHQKLRESSDTAPWYQPDVLHSDTNYPKSEQTPEVKDRGLHKISLTSGASPFWVSPSCPWCPAGCKFRASPISLRWDHFLEWLTELPESVPLRLTALCICIMETTQLGLADANYYIQNE